MKQPANQAYGFTLTEVLVALVIGAMVLVVSLGVYRMVTTHRTLVLERSQNQAQCRYILDLLRDDLANLHRSPYPEQRKYAAPSVSSRATGTRLLMYVTRRPDGGDAEAGDVFEVEYLLEPNDENDRLTLFRREAPLTFHTRPQPRGVLTELSGEVGAFDIDTFVEDRWVDHYGESDELPSLVRISLEIAPGDEPPVVINRIIAAVPYTPDSELPEQPEVIDHDVEQATL